MHICLRMYIDDRYKNINKVGYDNKAYTKKHLMECFALGVLILTLYLGDNQVTIAGLGFEVERYFTGRKFHK